MYLVKKMISGKEYWYARESKRENGKVKSKNVAYFGADRIEAVRKFEELTKDKNNTVLKEEKQMIDMKENFVLLHGFTGTSEDCFFAWLRKELEKRGHKVIAPQMPNTNNPDILEQVDYVIKNINFNENTILLGHSLGVVISLKVLEKLNTGIKGFISVAGFNKPGFKDKIRPFEQKFDGKFDFEKIKRNSGKVLILRDENDSIVPAERADLLKSLIGGRIISFKARENHVCGNIEPEVLKACLIISEDMAEEKPKLTIEELSIFCKRKGFVFKSSEIYGGMSGFLDYGPLGVELFNNIKNDFWKFFVHEKENMVGLDCSIISHPKTWEASGHVASFSDVAVTCKKCKKATKLDKSEVGKVKCECGGEYDIQGTFSLMFKTQTGALNPMEAYLRGETAQGMFLDFKNVYDSSRVKLPFGIVQIGNCFRNEIAPRDFLFRCREFTIGEFEFFIHPEDDECNLLDEVHLNLKLRLLDAETQEKGEDNLKETTIGKMIKEKRLGNWHAYWLAEQMLWFKKLGILGGIKIREHMKSELSHYSSATFDLDYEYPFGSKEIGGNANRGQYDLKQHEKFSGESMEIFDEKTKSKIIPRVIEPTFGIGRVFLALIAKGYHFDEKRQNIVLKLPAYLAPIKAAVFPIIKEEKFENMARSVFADLKKDWKVVYDATGSVGRRYSRNDEIGTPYCVTIDGSSLDDNSVTIRDRDSTKQIRVSVYELREIIRKLISGEIEFEKAGKLVETRVKEE